jgi:phosphatidylinositol-3,4,5-trisphosphate 5-phosphatase 2
MVGQLILLFSKDEIKHRFSYICTSKVKTGLGGSGGNKGSVAIRFSFDDTTFGFMNCHLASG